MENPENLPVEGFNRVLANQWLAMVSSLVVGFLQLFGDAISAWGFLLEADPWFYFNYELQCGANLTFEAMTGSFRFWMEALRMRGSLWFCMVWQTLRCLWVSLEIPLGEMVGGSTMHWLCGEVFHSWLCNGGEWWRFNISKGGVKGWYPCYSDMLEGVMDFCMQCSILCTMFGFDGFSSSLWPWDEFVFRISFTRWFCTFRRYLGLGKMRQWIFLVILMPTLCFGNVLQPRGCFELSLKRVCSRRAVFEQIQTFCVLCFGSQDRKNMSRGASH